MPNEYRQFQIAGSEAMRAACDLTISHEERVNYLEQAIHFAANAFGKAEENVFARMLAIAQYQCAHAMLLLAQTGYDSRVIRLAEIGMYEHIGEDIDKWFENEKKRAENEREG